VIKKFLFGFRLPVFAAVVMGALPLKTKIQAADNNEKLKSENRTGCIEATEAKIYEFCIFFCTDNGLG
jgi:hypothetical protein